MALKPKRDVLKDDINFRCASVAEKGYLVCYSSTAGHVESVATAISGKKVAGMLLLDVVNKATPSNLSLGEDHGWVDREKNVNRIETYQSGVVRLAKMGEVRTNALNPADWANFAQGDKLYLSGSGKLSRSQAAGAEHVGHALSARDSDGYLAVFLNIL